jgi:catechol 2,3-dioxygenase-like lactoylglutathione lyase family enzyme
MKKLSPILWTKNLDETISFYENVLGFRGTSKFQNFVYLSKADVGIMFVLPVDEPEVCKDPDHQEEFFPKPVLTGSIYIYMDNVDEFWDSVKDKVTIKSKLENRGYLMRDFSILDNNGYELVFGQDIGGQSI